MNIEKFVEERNSALLSMDKRRIKKFAKKYGLQIPDNEKAFWMAVHKAICNIANIPFEVRLKSADWLYENGSKPEIFGEERP